MERKREEKRRGDLLKKTNKVSVNGSKCEALPSSFNLLGCADHLEGKDSNVSLAAE